MAPTQCRFGHAFRPLTRIFRPYTVLLLKAGEGAESYTRSASRQAMAGARLDLNSILHPQSQIMFGRTVAQLVARWRHIGLALVMGVCAALFAGGARADTPYELDLPRGFPDPRIPEDNPLTWEKIELGRFLFFDTRLSGNQTFACASCHQPDKAFTDGRPQAVGSTGDVHPRSSMSLANIAYAGTLTWANPEVFLLEKQMETPMFGTNPVELGLAGKEQELFDRLRADPRYQRMFAEAFPDREDLFSLFTIEH